MAAAYSKAFAATPPRRGQPCSGCGSTCAACWIPPRFTAWKTSDSPPINWRRPCRSEEHTSELQSLRHVVCRLLLEKKHHANGVSEFDPAAARDLRDRLRRPK